MRIIKTWEFRIEDEYSVRDDLREIFHVSLEGLLDAAALIHESDEYSKFTVYLNRYFAALDAGSVQYGWDDEETDDTAYKVEIEVIEHTVRVEV